MFPYYKKNSPYAYTPGYRSIINFGKKTYTGFRNRGKMPMGGYKGSLAQKNRREIMKIQKKIEWKFIDRAASNVASPAGGIFVAINDTTGGTDEQNRIGELQTNRSISLKWRITANVASINVETIRCILFIDWYGRTTPTLNTVLVTDLITSGGIPIIQHFRQDNRVRYTILMDKTYEVSDLNSVQQSYTDKYYKKRKWMSKYTGTAATDLGKGVLYFLHYSTAASSAPVISWDARVYFNDA